MTTKGQLLGILKYEGYSEHILRAFERVPREAFVPENLRHRAYENRAFPLGPPNTTISQPSTIAKMLKLSELEPGQRVMEVGSGCSYVLALLSHIVGPKGKVYGVEINEELYKRSFLSMDDYHNVKLYNQDGKIGLISEAPFNRIIVSAACKEEPETLLYQLKDRGILVAPIGPNNLDLPLQAIQRKGDKFDLKDEIEHYMFVPLV